MFRSDQPDLKKQQALQSYISNGEKNQQNWKRLEEQYQKSPTWTETYGEIVRFLKP